MKVLRIIVDGELPKSCGKCDYKTYDVGVVGYVCLARSAIRPMVIIDVNTIPDWCPLEVELVKWWETVQTLGNTGEE